LPGYLTTIGEGTFVDPDFGGGKLNVKAEDWDVVTKVNVEGQDYLWYKAPTVNVAFIRATTADPEGNLTNEHESLVGDTRLIALAAKNSGGLVVAQVERIAAERTLPARSVSVPGMLVDCVCVAPPEEHMMSYFTQYNPSWSGELHAQESLTVTFDSDVRKMISRRAAIELNPGDVVNLGVGMPPGVAAVAQEEYLFDLITLTTEAGAIGGVGE
jgi:propionate CoA-transferase